MSLQVYRGDLNKSAFEVRKLGVLAHTGGVTAVTFYLPGIGHRASDDCNHNNHTYFACVCFNKTRLHQKKKIIQILK